MALAIGGRAWHREGEGGAKASAAFLPSLLALLEDAGIGVADLDAIAFGRGPGAFTGLRVACAVAQGLAFGAGKPVLPIDTLLAIAEDACRADIAVGARVWALTDARMDEIYAAAYERTAGGWEGHTAPMLTTAEALNRIWRAAPPDVIAGPALVAYGT